MDKQDIFWSKVLNYIGKLAAIILVIVAIYLYGISEGFFSNPFGAEIRPKIIFYCGIAAAICFGGSYIKK